jgi:hypothetical protein
MDIEEKRKRADDVMSRLLEDTEVQELLRLKLNQIELVKPT